MQGLVEGGYPASAVLHRVWGEEYMNKGKYDLAIAEFTKALTISPDMGHAYFNRGLAYAEKSEYDNALNDVQKAQEVGYNVDKEIVYRLRESVAKKSEYDWAIREMTRRLQTEPHNPLLYNDRGEAHRLKGELDQAIADYSKALDLNPRLAVAYSNRGIAYRTKGELDRAIADYSKAVGIDPQFALGYYNRAKAFYYKKEYDKAWGDLHKAQELGKQIDPDFIGILRQASGRNQ